MVFATLRRLRFVRSSQIQRHTCCLHPSFFALYFQQVVASRGELGEHESQSKPGIQMVYPEPCEELRRRPQLFSGWDRSLLTCIYPGFEHVAHMRKTQVTPSSGNKNASLPLTFRAPPSPPPWHLPVPSPRRRGAYLAGWGNKPERMGVH